MCYEYGTVTIKSLLTHTTTAEIVLREYFTGAGKMNDNWLEEVRSDYAKWLEDRIVEMCPTHICEGYMDTQQGNDWCQDNCEYSSIQKECLRHIYLDTVLGGENE